MTLTVEETLMAEEKIKKAKLMSFGLEGNHEAIIAALKLAKKHGVQTMTNAAPARADLDPRWVGFNFFPMNYPDTLWLMIKN